MTAGRARKGRLRQHESRRADVRPPGLREIRITRALRPVAWMNWPHFLVIRFDDAAHSRPDCWGQAQGLRRGRNLLRLRRRHDLGDLGIEPGDTVVRRAARARTAQATTWRRSWERRPSTQRRDIGPWPAKRTGSATPQGDDSDRCRPSAGIAAVSVIPRETSPDAMGCGPPPVAPPR